MTYAKGRFVQWCSLSTGSDAILVLLLQTTGLDADTTLQDFPTLSSLLAANTEANFTNYARKVLTSGITISVNTTANTATISLANFTWLAAGGAVNNTLGKLVTAYRPTPSSADAQCIPMTYHDCTATTTGADLLVQISLGNLAVAS